MQLKPWRTGLVLLGVGVALAAITLARCRHTASTSVARLPHGGTLTLLSAHVGTNHAYLSPPWDRLLSRLPASWLGSAGIQARRVSFQTPVLFVRLLQGGSDQELAFVLADHTGLESATSLDCEKIRRGDNTFLYVTGSSFPRRGSLMRLRAYASWPGMPLTNLAAEFSIPYPVATDSPTWTPEPLPAVRQDAAITMMLRDLWVDVRPVDVSPAGTRVLRGTTTVSWRITDQGRLQRDWVVRNLAIRDATGNAERLGDWARQPVQGIPGDIMLRFLWPLWAGEAAYRLEVEFDRTAEATFAPDEVWTVKGIVLPPRDGVTEVNARTNLLGQNVELIALVGDHATMRGREHDVFEMTTLELAFPPLADNQTFRVVRIVDDQGRAVRSFEQVGEHSFGFRSAPGARSADVTLAIYRRPRATFTVQPELPPASRPVQRESGAKSG